MPHLGSGDGRQADRTARLLEACFTLLDAMGEPLHYRDLTNALVESGMWADPWGKEPDQILYSALHNYHKRHGRAGRALFMGGGVFVSAAVEGAAEVELPEVRENAAPRDPYRRRGDMPGDAERRRAQAEADEANRRCGNCTHLSWDGPNEHTHEVGGCSLYNATGRGVVFADSPACCYWKARTISQRQADSERPRLLKLEARVMLATGKMRSGLK